MTNPYDPIAALTDYLRASQDYLSRLLGEAGSRYGTWPMPPWPGGYDEARRQRTGEPSRGAQHAPPPADRTMGWAPAPASAPAPERTSNPFERSLYGPAGAHATPRRATASPALSPAGWTAAPGSAFDAANTRTHQQRPGYVPRPADEGANPPSRRADGVAAEKPTDEHLGTAADDDVGRTVREQPELTLRAAGDPGASAVVLPGETPGNLGSLPTVGHVIDDWRRSLPTATLGVPQIDEPVEIVADPLLADWEATLEAPYEYGAFGDPAVGPAVERMRQGERP